MTKTREQTITSAITVADIANKATKKAQTAHALLSTFRTLNDAKVTPPWSLDDLLETAEMAAACALKASEHADTAADWLDFEESGDDQYILRTYQRVCTAAERASTAAERLFKFLETIFEYPA